MHQILYMTAMALMVYGVSISNKAMNALEPEQKNLLMSKPLGVMLALIGVIALILAELISFSYIKISPIHMISILSVTVFIYFVFSYIATLRRIKNFNISKSYKIQFTKSALCGIAGVFLIILNLCFK